MDPNDDAFSFTPAITVDHRAQEDDTDPRAFVAYTHHFLDTQNDAFEGAWAHSATSTTAADTWANGLQVRPVLEEPDNSEVRMSTNTTIRFSGRPKEILIARDDEQDYHAVSNTEVAASDPYVGALGPRALATNGENQTDIWVVHDTGLTDKEFAILRLDP